MKFQVLNRKVHYWGAAVIAIPVLIIIATGLLLQLKKQFSWVQPPEQRGVGNEPALSLAQILEICQGVPQAEVRIWADVNRIDVRPSRGMLKVCAKSNFEIQIDAQTGQVLQVAYRRSDLIEAIHDGSWFHKWVKLGVFLPAGLILLLLWLTGMYLFCLPILARRRKQLSLVRARERAEATTAAYQGDKNGSAGVSAPLTRNDTQLRREQPHEKATPPLRIAANGQRRAHSVSENQSTNPQAPIACQERNRQ